MRWIPTDLGAYQSEHDDIITYTYQNDTSYTPTRDGYTFDGWYSDITLTTPSTLAAMPAADIVLYGRWIEE
jgi:uncharacterized repeat protein (TIGR02543 family)